MLLPSHGFVSKPMARLVPFGAPKRRRKSGGWEGRGWISDDFNDPLPDDILDAFEGRKR